MYLVSSSFILISLKGRVGLKFQLTQTKEGTIPPTNTHWSKGKINNLVVGYDHFEIG